MLQRKRLPKTSRIKSIIKLAGAIAAMTFSAVTALAAAPTQVRIETGVIEGAVNADVLTFKGIPFAAPPLGELRWRPPQPALPWEGGRRLHAEAGRRRCRAT